MVESLTDRIMRRIDRERVRTKVEKVMPIDQLPDLLEAASLESRVFVELFKSEGDIYEVTHGKETTTAIVPEGYAQVRISSTKPSLSTFWNTFYALREYDQPIPQS